MSRTEARSNSGCGLANEPAGASGGLLAISPYPLAPTRHGGAVRLCELLRRRVAAGERVTVLVMIGGTDDPLQRTQLEAHGFEVYFARRPAADDARASERLDLSPEAAALASPQLAGRIRALVAAHRYDTVLLVCAEMGQYAAPYAGAATVLDEQDLAFRTHGRRRRSRFGGRYRGHYGRFDQVRRWVYELRILQQIDQIHLMSDTDRRQLAALLPHRRAALRVVPNGVDIVRHRPGAPAAERRDLLFVGSFPHLPNLDALDWFLEAVWPLVRAERPNARLTVAGAQPPQRVLALDGQEGLRVVGEVPDLGPLYRSHRALVVPLRAGSGTRLKILEAMASALPTVSTTIGAEGIDARDGEHLDLADDPDSLARALVRLLDADGRVDRIGRAGRALVERRYAWDAIARDHARALAEAPRRPRAPAPTVFRSVVSTGAEPARLPVDVTVAVAMPRAATEGPPAALESMLLDQKTERTWELLWAQAADDDRPGSAWSACARAARGTVLLCLDGRATPIFDTFLDEMVEPLFAAAPPAAVQGRVQERDAPDREPWEVDAVGPARAREPFPVDARVLALRLDTWRAWPLGEEALPGAHWQERLEGSGLWVMPRWSAVVWLDRAAPLEDLLRRGVAEGASWRALGRSYPVAELVSDLRTPRPELLAASLDRDRFRAAWSAAVHRSQKLRPWVWPLALAWGNQRRRAVRALGGAVLAGALVIRGVRAIARWRGAR